MVYQIEELPMWPALRRAAPAALVHPGPPRAPARRARATGPPRAPERRPVKPAPFTYHRTRDVAETVALLAELGDEAKILAGGQSLVPMMNFRLARPSALVDVTKITGLSYLRADPPGPDGRQGLRIGALTTHRAVEISRDPAVLNGFGVLPRSARWIGHYPIRS